VTGIAAEKAFASKNAVFNALTVFAYTHQCYVAVHEGRITGRDLQPVGIGQSRASQPGGAVVSDPYAQGGELERVALNAVTVALGSAAIITDQALQETIGPAKPEDESPDGAMRNVVHMLRCAFAHEGTSEPLWRCDRNYRRTYVVAEAGISFDGAALNGRPFRIDDAGGWLSYIKLLAIAHRRIQGLPMNAMGHP
jgi:hypothetical protein